MSATSRPALSRLTLAHEPGVLGEPARVEEERHAVAVAERPRAAHVLERDGLPAARVVRDRDHHQRHPFGPVVEQQALQPLEVDVPLERVEARRLERLRNRKVDGGRLGELDVRTGRVEVRVVRDDLAAPADRGEQDLLRRPALVRRDHVREREQLLHRLEEREPRRRPRVALVAVLDRRPLVARHRTGPGVGEQVDQDVHRPQPEQIEPTRLERGAAVGLRRHAQRLDGVDPERLDDRLERHRQAVVSSGAGAGNRGVHRSAVTQTGTRGAYLVLKRRDYPVPVGIRTRRFPNERLVVLAGLGVASALCLGLELVRERHYDAYGFRFLIWNLFLAWIPLLLALLIYDRYRRGRPLLVLAPALVLWLLFLPNAPYIVTDFVHLSRVSRAPLWLDGVEVSAFAWTGMLLGFVSLYLVHAVARHRFGAAAGWVGVFGVLGLVSVGVYLGRVKRWNSWDMLTQPGARLAQLHAHLADPASLARAAAVTVAVTVLLTAAYLVFYVLMAVRLETPRPARRQ